MTSDEEENREPTEADLSRGLSRGLGAGEALCVFLPGGGGGRHC